jgi:hypothetical protein
MLLVEMWLAYPWIAIPNAHIEHKGRLQLFSQHILHHRLLAEWRQRQGSACAAPTSGWPGSAQVVQLLWRIDVVFAASSIGRLIHGTYNGQ